MPNWLEQAIQKHDPKVTVALAWSYILKLDTLDTHLLTRSTTDISETNLN